MFLCAFVLPVIGMVAGWIGSGFKTGAIVGLATFAFFFVLGGLFAALTEKPSWFAVSLPFISGVLYSAISPFPLPFDDIVVASAGAITSAALYLKHYENAPKWIVIPLVVSALYTLVGEFVPSPVDEFLVGIIALGTTAVAAQVSQTKGAPAGQLPATETPERDEDKMPETP